MDYKFTHLLHLFGTVHIIHTVLFKTDQIKIDHMDNFTFTMVTMMAVKEM